MKATIVPEMNIPNMDTYWSILKNLSSDMKLELISRLSKSLLSKDQSIDDNWPLNLPESGKIPVLQSRSLRIFEIHEHPIMK